jgi:hypothetical protein
VEALVVNEINAGDSSTEENPGITTQEFKVHDYSTVATGSLGIR